MTPRDLLWAKLYREHRGRENAVPRAALLLYLADHGLPMADRRLREAYEDMPICSCQDGLFVPIRREEVLEYERYLSKKIAPWKVREKIARIYEHFPWLDEQSSAVQMELF